MGGLAFGLLQNLEIVFGLFNEVFLVLVVLNDSGVLGERDDLAGAETAHQERVADDAGTECLHAVLGGIRALAGSNPGLFIVGNPELPGFAVADHIESHRAHERKAKEDAKILGFAQKDVSAEGGMLDDLALTSSAFGGSDFDCGS